MESNPVKHPLRTFVGTVLTRFPGIAGTDIILKFITILQFSSKGLEALISNHFQSIVQSLGQGVASDEKLFHFTGDSVDVRLVISKPDKIGLWFYELVGALTCGAHYLLYLKMHTYRDNEVVKVTGIDCQ